MIVAYRTSLIALLFAIPVFSQNIIPNPGFENDLAQWNTFWTRDTGAGTFTIATSPVHSGVKSGHVRHTGALDWSASPSLTLAVKPGQLYRYSAWIDADLLPAGSDAQISVVLQDSAKTALNWAYAAKACSLSTGFVQYSSTFLIPSGVSYIQPRIIGDGPCDLYADDISLTLADSVPLQFSHPYRLQNATVKVTLDPVSFVITLQSLATSKSYATQAVGFFKTSSVDSSADSLTFHCDYLPDGWPVVVTAKLSGPALCIRLIADSSRAMSAELPFPGPIASSAGDFLIIPKGTGLICPASGAPSYMSRYFWIGLSDWQSDLCFTGVTDKTSGYMITTDDPWFTRLSYTTTSGSTALAPHVVMQPGKHLFAKNRTLYYTLVDTGGYASMCSWYRGHAETNGWVSTFSQKSALAPQINRLAGAADFWILGKGFYYGNASEFRRWMDLGLDRAIFSGNFSNSVVDTLNSLGFLTSEYDCYCDAYPPGNAGYKSDGYGAGAIVNEDGSIMNGWLAYLSGGQTLQAQEVCSAVQCGYALPRITTERAVKRLNCRFIDVELAMGLQECYSPSHPVNKYTDALARKQLFDTLRSSFGLVLGGEQARDFAFPFVDYGEGTMSPCPAVNAGYDWMTPAAPDSDFVHYDINPAIRVPLHGLVYHDVHVPTWYTGDGMSRVPAYWDDKDLFNILYASMPLIMPPDTGYWNTNFERFLTSYNLVTAVTRSVGFAKMTSHAFVIPDGRVQQTGFDNGWHCAVNFDSINNYALDGRTLAARGFYASNGTEEVYRLSAGTGKIACARLHDRLFVNGYGGTTEAFGVRSTGGVFLRKDSTCVTLSFIGGQQSIDLNPATIPWPLSGMRVFTKDKSQELTPVALGDGFYKISRVASAQVYRIEGIFASVVARRSGTTAEMPSIDIRSGFQHRIIITLQGSQLGTASISICDAGGREVQSIQVPGTPLQTKAILSRPLNNGIYVVRCKTAGSVKTARVAVMR
jgi:hypothetical protein